MSDRPTSQTYSDKGIEASLGIGHGGKLLNTHHAHLQEELNDYRDDFLEVRSYFDDRNMRHDFLREGLLGEILSRTSVLIYDLPELLARIPTAFVDMSGKMYIAAPFFLQLAAEQKAGLDSLNFIFRHEADHLRRLHLSRMTEFPHGIANRAQDMRINIDITASSCSQDFSDRNNGREPSRSDLEAAISDFYSKHDTAVSAISVGIGMNIEDYKKFEGLSEESIATIMIKDWKEPPKIPNTKVSFEHILEGAAQESDHVKAAVSSGLSRGGKSKLMTPSDISHLANELRRIGKAKANPSKVSDADLTSALDGITKLKTHPVLMERDTSHEKASSALAGSGASHTSAKTGDAYLDLLKPSERVDIAIEILNQILNPKAGAGGQQKPQDGLQVIDIERTLGRGKGTPGPKEPGNGESRSDGSKPGDGTGTEGMIPAPTVDSSLDHVMGTEELVDILSNAGLSSSSMEKLGYDDLKKVGVEVQATRDNLVSAINKATEDMMAVGARYPGGHLVNYAKAQMLDFFKPVLSWEMAFKKIVEGSGKGTHFDITEPWSIYSVDHADMGFSSQRDVPYQGSYVPGKVVKPLIFVPIDTSGSVNDAMLKRFISEAINMARRVSRGTAPEVVIVFADTVARGAPVFITEKNYQNFLEQGLSYGGRGGTNLGAGIESIFEMVKPGSKSGYAKRNIDAIVYFTDTFDVDPVGGKLLRKAQQCGMKKLPTTLFLAPQSCFNESFKKNVSNFAETIFFDTKSLMKIDLKQQDRLQDVKNRSLKPTLAAR